MKLSEKYALAMFSGRKQMDPEIIESLMSVGLLVAILYEMLEENMLKLENNLVLLSTSCDKASGAKEKIVSQMQMRGEKLSLEDWIKHLVFSVDSLCMKVIVSETEKEMITKGYINLIEKKSLFTKKMVYRCKEEVLSNLAKDAKKLETLEEFLLPYLLDKCGLLSYVVPKADCKLLKQKIHANVYMNNDILGKINQIISSVSSTLATANIMM